MAHSQLGTWTDSASNKTKTPTRQMSARSIDSEATSFTMKTLGLNFPKSLGPPAPVLDMIPINDSKALPRTVKFLYERKEAIAKINKLAEKSLPTHIQNLKDLSEQYETHSFDFKTLAKKHDILSKKLEEVGKSSKRLEAKNSTYQKQLAQLENQNNEFEALLCEKEEAIRSLEGTVRNQKVELDEKISLAERRFIEVKDRAIKEATFEKSQILKKKEAKLAQLKHVLGKSKFAEGDGYRLGESMLPHPSGVAAGAGTRLHQEMILRGRSPGRVKNSNSKSRQVETIQGVIPAYQSRTALAAVSPSVSKRLSPTPAHIRQHQQVHQSPSIVQSRSRNLDTNGNCNSTPIGAPLRRSRSKSMENLSASKQMVLAHQPKQYDQVETNTILQPNIKSSKMVQNLPANKELQKYSKYYLRAQQFDSEGELETQFLKGDIVKTKKLHKNSEHGVAVQFTDVEIVKSRDPVVKAMRPNGENSFIRNSPSKMSRNGNISASTVNSPGKYAGMIKRVKANLNNISDAISHGGSTSTLG